MLRFDLLTLAPFLMQDIRLRHLNPHGTLTAPVDLSIYNVVLFAMLCKILQTETRTIRNIVAFKIRIGARN